MNLKNMHWVNKDLEYKDVVYAILSIRLLGETIIFYCLYGWVKAVNCELTERYYFTTLSRPQSHTISKV